MFSNQMFAPPRSSVVKGVSGDNSVGGQVPSFEFFEGEVKVSREPTGSRLPSAQNNSHAQGSCLGVGACSEPQ